MNENICFNCPGCNVFFSLEKTFYNKKCQCTSCGLKFLINDNVLKGKKTDKKIIVKKTPRPSQPKGKRTSTTLLTSVIVMIILIALTVLILAKNNPPPESMASAEIPAPVIHNTQNEMIKKASEAVTSNKKQIIEKIPSAESRKILTATDTKRSKKAQLQLSKKINNVPSSFLPELPKASTSIANLSIPKTDTHPVDWANPGNIGPIGVIAQRSIKRREYKVLVVERNSPADGKLQPGDLIVGVKGEHFKAEKYPESQKSLEKACSFMEPNRAFGNAFDEAMTKNEGHLILTVKRDNKEGIVQIQLPWDSGFSKSYPWNCPRSEQLLQEMADQFIKGKLPYKRDLFGTAWYGLFLLSYDPVKYKSKIDEILQLLLVSLPSLNCGDAVRGIRGGMNTWHASVYSQFLSEYALTFKMQDKMKPHLQQMLNLLLGIRMEGSLWGHHPNHNYGRLEGGFIAASTQAALSMICLRRAGATIPDEVFNNTMNSIKSSINPQSGQVSYWMDKDNGHLKNFDWNAINSESSQLGAESLMRQGTTMMIMKLTSSPDAAKAAAIFGKRMLYAHKTHGIAPEWGIHEAARSYALMDMDTCRKLLDIYRYRLCLSLKWNGGVELIPYKNRRGEEYGKDSFGGEKYITPIIGLILSLHKKRLFLHSGSLIQKLSSDTKLSQKIRKPVYANGCIYYSTSSLSENWSVYEYNIKNSKARLIKGGFTQPIHELKFWKGKLYMSIKGASMEVWDGNKTEQLLSVKNNNFAPCQMTEFQDKLYFVAPRNKKEKKNSGELWVTDGTRGGTVKVVAGKELLVGGNGGWQTNTPHAESLKCINDKLVYVTCKLEGGTKPAANAYSIWSFDGRNHTILARQKPYISTIDDNNAQFGSYLGIEYKNNLYFNLNKTLWQTDGTAKGTKSCNLDIKEPNNFSVFKNKLVFSGTLGRSLAKKKKIKGRKEGIFTYNGNAEESVIVGQYRNIRQITSGSSRFYFSAETPEYGQELWTSNGTKPQMVKDIKVGRYGSFIDNLTCIDDYVYFTASGNNGQELWISNGTEAGTRLQKIQEAANIYPQFLMKLNKHLIFTTETINSNKQIHVKRAAR